VLSLSEAPAYAAAIATALRPETNGLGIQQSKDSRAAALQGTYLTTKLTFWVKVLIVMIEGWRL
jgi:hypothetical protein